MDEIWKLITLFGGIAKTLELLLTSAILIISFVALSRIKGLVRDINETTVALESKMQSVKAELSDLADTLNDQFVSTRQVPAQRESVEGSLERWDQIRSIWRMARERVENKVLSIKDGRKSKKYASKDWRDYADIINSLAEDGKMTAPSKDAVLEMYKLFNKLRLRQAQISDEELKWFLELARRFGLGNKIALTATRQSVTAPPMAAE